MSLFYYKTSNINTSLLLFFLCRLKITKIANIKISPAILKTSIVEKSFATSLVISVIFIYVTLIIAVVFISSTITFFILLVLALLRNTTRNVLLLFSIVVVDSRIVDLRRFVGDILIVIKPPVASSPASTVPEASS